MAIERPAGQMGAMAPGTVGEGTWPVGVNVSGASGQDACRASGSTGCSVPPAHLCAWYT